MEHPGPALRAPVWRFGSFSRNVATTLVAQVLCLGIAMANTALVVRWLGPGGKGMLDLALLVPPMLGGFLSAGVGLANLYYVGSRRLSVSTLVSNALAFAILATGAGAVVVTILFLTGAMGKLVSGVPYNLLLLAMVGLPLTVLLSYFTSILHGLNRIQTLNVINTGSSATMLLLTLVLVVGLRWGLFGAVLSHLGGMAVTVTCAAVLLRRAGAEFRPRFVRPIMRSTVGFGLRGHIGNILQFLNYRLDVFLVNSYLGVAQVGIYGIATRLAELLWNFPQAVSFAILPKAAAASTETMRKFTPRVFGLTLALTALGGLGLVVVGRFLIELIFSSAFSGAYRPLLFLLPGVVLLGGGKVLTNEMAGRGFPHYNSYNAGGTLIITIALDILLIPRYGITGAALASSISYSVSFFTAIIMFLHLRRKGGSAQGAES